MICKVTVDFEDAGPKIFHIVVESIIMVVSKDDTHEFHLNNGKAAQLRRDGTYTDYLYPEKEMPHTVTVTGTNALIEAWEAYQAEKPKLGSLDSNEFFREVSASGKPLPKEDTTDE